KVQQFSNRQLLLSGTAIALTLVLGVAIVPDTVGSAKAQNAEATPASSSELPPVRVDEPNRAPRRKQSTERKPPARTAAKTQRRNRRTVAAPPPAAPATPPTPSSPLAASQDARTGTVGVYSNSTSIATKTNTPLVNIPQTVNVLTKDYIADQSFQSVTDATR